MTAEQHHERTATAVPETATADAAAGAPALAGAAAVTVTDEAAELVRRRGGAAAIDYIAPVGCGKVPELSVDTYLVGKDTSRHHAVDIDGVRVWVSPKLARVPGRLELRARRGLLRRRLVAVREAAAPQGPAACAT